MSLVACYNVKPTIAMMADERSCKVGTDGLREEIRKNLRNTQEFLAGEGRKVVYMDSEKSPSLRLGGTH